jgi:hypothetical protein
LLKLQELGILLKLQSFQLFSVDRSQAQASVLAKQNLILILGTCMKGFKQKRLCRKIHIDKAMLY